MVSLPLARDKTHSRERLFSLNRHIDRFTGARRLVTRIDDSHQRQSLICRVQGCFIAKYRVDEVLRRSDPSHIGTRRNLDRAVDSCWAILGKHLTGIDCRVIEPVGSEQTLHFDPGPRTLQVDRYLFSLNHFSPRDLKTECLPRCERDQTVGRRFNIGYPRRIIGNPPRAFEVGVIDKVVVRPTQHNLRLGEIHEVQRQIDHVKQIN